MSDVPREKIVETGMREMMRKTRLSQHTLETIRNGKPVRRATLQRVLGAVSLG